VQALRELAALIHPGDRRCELLCGRAAARLALKLPGLALEDAQSAVAVNRKFVKGYMQMSQCHLA